MSPFEEVYATYKYRENVPREGLMIDGKPALTGIDPAKVGDYVLIFVRDPLCAYGDADPATKLATRLENAEKIGESGMFTSWSGTYKGARITAVSGGSGCPEAELCMTEYLEHTNASTYIRVGGSGGTHETVRPGDVVIASAVVRSDGLSAAYVASGWPAVCSPDLVMALAEAAKARGVPHHIGLTRSSDSDISGSGRPGVRAFMRPHHAEFIDDCRRMGVLNGEREASAIVTMASLFGRRGGSVCSVADNVVTGEKFEAGAGHTAAVDIALEGVALLAQMDRAKEKAGARYWVPSIGLE